jgi:TRAP-type mannitol/chloroaromatic compound transport system permease small subunit
LIGLHRALERLSEVSGRLVSWLTLGMVLVTFLVVVLRYAFDTGWIAMQESVSFMHALVFMLGAAFTLRHDGHVRVDIFYGRYGRRGRAVIDLLGTLLLLLPTSTFILWMGWEYVANAWAVREGSREAGGLPGVYLLKTLILIMPILLILQGLAWVLQAVLVLTGRGPAPPTEGTA